MTSTRIRIDLKAGIVEAEGTEEFVRYIYVDFRDRLEPLYIKKHTLPTVIEEEPRPKESITAAPKKKRSGAGRTTPSIVNNLDLSGGGKIKRLREFYAQFKPKSNFENNLIFIYYLAQEMGLSGVTVDHIFTCYRDIPGLKAPTALSQSLLDTKHHHGWINTSSMGDIKLTIQGMNYLEHDMPKAEA
jgi:hypothetical protein